MTFELPPTAFSFLLFSFLSSRTGAACSTQEQPRKQGVPSPSLVPASQCRAKLSPWEGQAVHVSHPLVEALFRAGAARDLGISSPTQPTLAGKKLCNLGTTGLKYWILMALLKQRVHTRREKSRPGRPGAAISHSHQLLEQECHSWIMGCFAYC